jgi:FMN phosphatase YigB (HAD superfamily)
MRRLLFLDVDGTLIPLHGNVFGEDDNPLLARLDPAHGPRLLALDRELVWATTWMQDATRRFVRGSDFCALRAWRRRPV